MWESIGERATDLIFRMESFNDDFVRSTWVDARTIKSESPRAIATENESTTSHQKVADQSSRGDTDIKPEPIRHLGPKVGRNDPCPCGSGKKYKSCCMKNMA